MSNAKQQQAAQQPAQQAVPGVIYTETFRMTFVDLINFLTASSVDNPKDYLDKQLGEFEAFVEIFPAGGNFPPELLELGCTTYLQKITKDGYRILYTYNAQLNQVVAHVILSKTQSIQGLLYKRIITF